MGNDVRDSHKCAFCQKPLSESIDKSGRSAVKGVVQGECRGSDCHKILWTEIGGEIRLVRPNVRSI
jgi:hypothetical protein